MASDPCRTVQRRLSTVDKQFLRLCLGESINDGCVSGESSESESSCACGSYQATDVAFTRKSRASIRHCMQFALASASDDEADTSTEPVEAMYFNMADSDSESESGLYDLEEAFSFDLAKVAEMLKCGCRDVEMLSGVIEQAMEAALESRLEESCIDEPSVEKNNDAAVTTSAVTGDLSGLMTPEGCSTPPSAVGSADEPSRQLAAQLRDRLSIAVRRRSSIAQHPQLAQAVASQNANHRRSVLSAAKAVAESMDIEPTKLRKSIAHTQSLRRQSLVKAAEVLEMTGIKEQEEINQQLKLVQKSVELAHGRHRKSVAQAVAMAACDGAVVKLSAPVRFRNPSKQRVQEAVAKAYERQKQIGKYSTAANVRGAPVALLHARFGSPGNPFSVHCGPDKHEARKQQSKPQAGGA